ncbi:MAG: C39 family peptidase, partial [Sandaracinaceae bacterium]
DADLLKTWIARGRPIISGLSATYLYGIARDDPDTNVADDVGGEPAGHFVVIAGYREGGRRFVVSDPYKANPMAATQRYEVEERRLLNAILLGDVTYDGVLLMVDPR